VGLAQEYCTSWLARPGGRVDLSQEVKAFTFEVRAWVCGVGMLSDELSEVPRCLPARTGWAYACVAAGGC
jgi:hypothetical protein